MTDNAAILEYQRQWRKRDRERARVYNERCGQKKAPTSSAKRVEAIGQGNFSGYSNPTNDSTTKPAGVQVTISGRAVSARAVSARAVSARAVSARAVSALLHEGRENALPLRALCQLTGIDGRQIRQMIQRERLKGVPILSDNQTGYYLPADKREVVEFVKSMRHRAGEIEKVADNVEAAASSYVIEGVYYGG